MKSAAIVLVCAFAALAGVLAITWGPVEGDYYSLLLKADGATLTVIESEDGVFPRGTEIKEAFHLYGSDRKAMQTFSDYDVLAIDEIGKAKETEYNVSALFTIIDKRRVNLKATLYAGNMELEEMKTYFTDPMVRRIKESGMFLNVGASDWRNAQ